MAWRGHDFLSKCHDMKSSYVGLPLVRCSDPIKYLFRLVFFIVVFRLDYSVLVVLRKRGEGGKEAEKFWTNILGPNVLDKKEHSTT